MVIGISRVVVPLTPVSVPLLTTIDWSVVPLLKVRVRRTPTPRRYRP